MDTSFPKTRSLGIGTRLPSPLNVCSSRGHSGAIRQQQKPKGRKPFHHLRFFVGEATRLRSILHDQHAVEALLGGTDVVSLRRGGARCGYRTWDINPDGIQ